MQPSRYTVLYVDDEVNNLIAFKNAFFRSYRILTAASASEGLALLKENEIQLVITDHRMPHMTGLEMLALVKRDYPETMRMIATGYSDLSVVMEAFNELGIFHYALKPWENQELKAVMDNALNKYQLTHDNRRLILELTQANELLEARIEERTRALAIKSEESARLNRLKDKLFSIISHDLRSPLASLSSFVEMYLKYDGIFTPQESQQAMTDMQHALVGLTEMLNNLLGWSRAQMDNVQLLPVQLPMQEVIEKQLAAYQLNAAQKNITIQTSVPADKLVVCADANMLHVVLRNLLSNAIKFTPEGGTITIRAVAQPTSAVISVTDTGVGISPENVQKLFADGELVSTLGTAKEKGTGLGLKLCKEYVEKLGGTLTVESQPQRGTTFRFNLPLAQLQPAIA